MTRLTITSPRPISIRRRFQAIGRGRNEPIALALDGLHESGVVWIISQHLSDLSDGGVNPVLRIHIYFFAPELLLDFLTGHKTAVRPHQ